jgi:hypothetical protein
MGRGIGGMGCSLDEASEDLPSGNPKEVIPALIFADSHQTDEAAPSAHSLKCLSRIRAGKRVVVLTGDLPPGFAVRRRLDAPRFQTMSARIMTVCSDD